MSAPKKKTRLPTNRRQDDKDPFQKLIRFSEDGLYLRGFLAVGTMLLRECYLGVARMAR